jgi:perosamine synthetase
MKFINQYEPLYGKEEKKAVNDYLNSGGWLTEFKKTREFEKRISDFVGIKYTSAVSNGTAAIFIALKALNIGLGDEVIVPDFTMAATANAVVLAGATPVFSDIEDKQLTLRAESAEKLITKKTKAIIHVSINGRAGELLKLKSLCRKKKLFLIEDAAQSLGSFYKRKHLGTFGEIGCFSFSVAKIVSTGQGGAVVTENPAIFKRIKRIKDFGRARGGIDIYEDMGWNFKFSDLLAVVGIAQIKKIKRRLKRKKEIFKLYRKHLRGVKEVEFIDTDLKEVSPWFQDVLVRRRDNLMKYLLKKGIDTRPFYPALHTQGAYKKNRSLLKMEGTFPLSTKISSKGLWLPSSLTLRDSEIERICKEIKSFYKK